MPYAEGSSRKTCFRREGVYAGARGEAQVGASHGVEWDGTEGVWAVGFHGAAADLSQVRQTEWGTGVQIQADLEAEAEGLPCGPEVITRMEIEGVKIRREGSSHEERGPGDLQSVSSQGE